MKNLFLSITALGLIGVGLHFLGVDMNLFGWTDSWGETVAHQIRAAIAAGAVALYALGAYQFDPEKQESRARSVRVNGRR